MFWAASGRVRRCRHGLGVSLIPHRCGPRATRSGFCPLGPDVFGRQPGGCGGAGGGGGRPVAAGSPAAGRSGNHRGGGAPSRPGRIRGPRASGGPADLDQGPPGAGCPVATGGSAGSVGGRFAAPGRWRVLWSFNCRSFARYGGGNVKLSGAGAFAGVSVQRVGSGDGASWGHWWRPGRLTVESVCDRWMVKAVLP
jgi:hypothetical protein